MGYVEESIQRAGAEVILPSEGWFDFMLALGVDELSDAALFQFLS
jgi:hypothetical protein